MKFWYLIFCLFLTSLLHAQLTVSSSNNATELAQKIVGQGVTILNPVYKGTAVSAGFFNDRTGTIGIDSGIVLTTGRVVSIGTTGNGIGVNGSAGLKAGYANGAASDADLNALLTGSGIRQDACVLEFDFIPQGDSINVNFVFASDEYSLYNCTQYNDVFGFLISGPGIVGTKNIALVPGTNIPVAINSINNGIPGSTGNISTCKNMGLGSPFTNLYRSNSGNVYVTYNGLTSVLKAELKVQPCQTYHIKLAIQDVIDGDFDSGVFLQASSFSSNAISIQSTGGFVDNQNNNFIVEGCKANKVKISLATPANTTINIPLLYSGTATFGVDYLPLPNQLTFNMGDISKEIDIVPIMDNISEPTETISIGIGGNTCSNNATSIVTMYIKDSVAFVQKKDTFVCSQFVTTVSAKYVDTTTNTYQWSTGENTRTKQITTAGTYWVIHKFSNTCYNIDTFKVTNGDPSLSIGNNIVFCNTDSVLVTAIVNPNGGNYLWNNGNTNNAIYVKNNGTVGVKYTAINGCYVNKNIQALVKPLPIVELGLDTSLCTYESIVLNATYTSASYLWSTGATTAKITVKDSAKYYVTNTLNGCTYSDSIFVDRKKPALANVGANVEIYTGGSANLIAAETLDNKTYLWTPILGLTTPNSSSTIASPSTTTTYILKVSSIDNCIAFDTIVVTVKDGNIVIPNAFSPNGDGINDTWQIKLLNSFLNAKVQVFNRQGQLVFNTKGYSKPWDGTSNGKPLPIGTYYYVIEPGNGLERKTGWIALLR